MNAETSAGIEVEIEDCTCEGWQEGEPQLMGFAILALTYGMKYTGEYWRYCPWCGKKLELKNPPIASSAHT